MRSYHPNDNSLALFQQMMSKFANALSQSKLSPQAFQDAQSVFAFTVDSPS